MSHNVGSALTRDTWRVKDALRMFSRRTCAAEAEGLKDPTWLAFLDGLLLSIAGVVSVDGVNLDVQAE